LSLSFSFSGKIEPNVLWFPFLFFPHSLCCRLVWLLGKCGSRRKLIWEICLVTSLMMYVYFTWWFLIVWLLRTVYLTQIYIYSARHASFSVRK
jgi:hypothetical protein